MPSGIATLEALPVRLEKHKISTPHKQKSLCRLTKVASKVYCVLGGTIRAGALIQQSGKLLIIPKRYLAQFT